MYKVKLMPMVLDIMYALIWYLVIKEIFTCTNIIPNILYNECKLNW